MSYAAATPLDGPESGWWGYAGRVARSAWFIRLIVVAIAATGVLSGLETYPAFQGPTLPARVVDWLQVIVLAVFVAEIAVKMASFGTHPWRYFRAGWNIFDFTVVAVCLLPLHAEYVVVLRLLRTLRLFTALEGLQILVSGLIRGIPALGYVGLLLLVHFYIYAVIGTFAFGNNDPIRFGSLHTTMLTLFQVLTLEGWNDILATQYHGSEVAYDEAWKQLASGSGRVSVGRPLAAAAYFVSFILIGTMIMLNLFTGVIIRSMEEASTSAADAARQRAAEKGGPVALHEEVRQLGEQLQTIAQRLAAIRLAEPPANGGGRAVGTGAGRAQGSG